MAIITLPSTHPDLEIFRRRCLEFGPLSFDPPIVTIAGVGVPYNATRELRMPDKQFMVRAFNICWKNLFSPSPDFKFMPIDMQDGNDFVDPALALQADMVFVCLAGDRTSGLWKNEGNENAPSLERFVAFSPELLTSPFHSKTAYYEAACRAGTRVIITFTRFAERGRHTEIDSSYFLGPGYEAGPCYSIELSAENEVLSQYKVETVFRADVKREIDIRKQHFMQPN